MISRKPERKRKRKSTGHSIKWESRYLDQANLANEKRRMNDIPSCSIFESHSYNIFAVVIPTLLNPMDTLTSPIISSTGSWKHFPDLAAAAHFFCSSGMNVSTWRSVCTILAMICLLSQQCFSVMKWPLGAHMKIFCELSNNRQGMTNTGFNFEEP